MSSGVRMKELREQLENLGHLHHVSSLLSWDQEVYMPHGGAEARAAQLAYLSGLRHDLISSEKLYECLSELQADATLDADEQVVVRETMRDVQRARLLPRSLVCETSRVQSETYALWLDSRQANSFAIVKGKLAELVELRRAYAKCLEPRKTVYDTLLDDHSRGMSSEVLLPLFSEVVPFLRSLLERCEGRYENAVNPAAAEIPLEVQDLFCQRVLAAVGMDRECARLDRTAHPFCVGAGPRDVRLTTRYDRADILSAIKTSLHEWGHGLYDLSFLPQWHYTPLGEAASLSIHESQSLLWEKHVGGSQWFWSHWFPKLQESCPEAFGLVSREAWVHYINRVKRTLVRVEADELTYGLHIVIRFELERALVENELTIDELPGAWIDGYRHALGIQPKDDKLGVLQDVHWYHGMFGYFPSYLLGAILSAQLFEAYLKSAKRTRQDMDVSHLGELREWLHVNIHHAGRRWSDAELIERATGAAPQLTAWKAYLTEKYA